MEKKERHFKVRYKDRAKGHYSEDADFLTGDAILFALYSDEIDEALISLNNIYDGTEKEQKDLIPFLIKELADQAKKVLSDYGHPTDLKKLNYICETRHGTKILQAKKVLESAEKILEIPQTPDVNLAILETLKFAFAAVGSDAHEVIYDGVRRNVERIDGQQKILEKKQRRMTDFLNEFQKVKGTSDHQKICEINKNRDGSKISVKTAYRYLEEAGLKKVAPKK